MGIACYKPAYPRKDKPSNKGVSEDRKTTKNSKNIKKKGTFPNNNGQNNNPTQKLINDRKSNSNKNIGISESTPCKKKTESNINLYETSIKSIKKDKVAVDNKKINNYNNRTDNNNNESKTTKDTKNNISYFDFNEESYIVCPDCKNLYPYIKDLNYDKEKKDFNILYFCDCFKDKKTLKKSYLLNFINDKKPTTINYDLITQKNLDKMKELSIENKKDIQGYKILENIIIKIKNIINRSMAPLANTLGESYRSITKSKFKESNVHLEKSGNYNIDGSDILFEEKNNLKSKIGKLSIINEEQNEEKNEFKNYKCTKTIKCNAIALSLIELKSGLIATCSNESKIQILDIKKSFYKSEFHENGLVNCLLEFEPNFLLSGDNRNNIYLWNIKEDKEEKYIYKFSGHKLSVNCLVKCNEKYFSSASSDKTIKIWDYEKRKLFRTIDAHDEEILSLIRLKNGNLCSGSKDKYIKIWNWQNCTNIDKIKIQDNMVKCLLQLDSETILYSSDKNINIYKNHEKIGYLDGHDDQINSLYKIKDNYIISGSSDKTIKIWDIKKKNCIQTLNEHIKEINCVIKLKNNTFVSCSNDKTIKIWEQN